MMILSDEASPPCKLTLQDDAPKGVLGNLPDRIDQLTSPFDITLELQDLHLHNCLWKEIILEMLFVLMLRLGMLGMLTLLLTLLSNGDAQFCYLISHFFVGRISRNKEGRTLLVHDLFCLPDPLHTLLSLWINGGRRSAALNKALQ